MKKISTFDIPCSTSCSSQGFTLIEILLVVVIILIATAVAVPVFRGTFQSTQMQDAVRSTLRMARYARSMSILKQDEYTLHLKKGSASLSGSDTNGTNTVTRRLPDDIKITHFENLAEPDRSDEEEYTVRFYPSGMNDGFKLTFSDERANRVYVRCNPITGKTTVEDRE